MICAWIETSSAETGSSPTISFGLERQRAGDADALALAAGELVRVVAPSAPAQADALEQRGDALAALLAARRCRARCSGSPTISPADMRGIERRVRILEDDLHLPAVGPQSRLAQARDVLAVKPDAAGGRLDQPQHGAADRRLAAAALADQAERLAALDREADAVDRDRPCPALRAQQALLDREMLLEVRRPRAPAALRARRICRSAIRSPRRARQQAAQWPGRFCSKRGYSRAAAVDRRSAQRGAKAQPGGQVGKRRHHAGDLLQPLVRQLRSRRASSASRGIEPSRPCV